MTNVPKYLFRTELVMGLIVSCLSMARAENVTSVGKYLCVVSKMAGIQYEPDGRMTVGGFQPAVEKFFVTVSQTSPELAKQCPWNPTMAREYWLGCTAKYAASIDGGPPMKGDDGHIFFGFLAIGDYFLIADDLKFNRFTTVFSSNGLFVSNGKCTRL